MKKILTLIVLLCCSLSVFAIPAKPGKIRYTQPDGTVIELVKHGDEWGHWITNAAGQVVVRDADGFYRVAEGVTAREAAKVASIRRAARRQMLRQAAKSSGHVAIGQKHFLVILVQFKDVSFTTQNAKQVFTNMLNQQGYSDNEATGSARDYYYENSHGVFEPIFDVYGPVTVSKNMANYGGNDSDGNDKAPEQAVVEGCKGLDSTINFADFDNDNDGVVDLVYMVYAGKGEADGGAEDTIWPHQWDLSSAGVSLKLDGKSIDRYACGSELSGEGNLEGIGTICHEFGHAMGLPDFYDTDYESNGETHGLSCFSLMDAGSYNNDGRTPPYLNVEERILLGWIDESVMEEFPKNGSYTLPSVDNNKAYKIPTDKDDEYFLLECRDDQGWDSGLYGAVGLIVYHVDKSTRTVGGGYTAKQLWDDWSSSNSINAYGSHPCFYVVPACKQSSLNYSIEYVEDLQAMLFPGGEDVSKKVTTYTPVSWNKVTSEISLSNIAYSNSKVTFTVSGVVAAGLDYPYIDNPGKGSYAAGSSFELKLNVPDEYPLQSVEWSLDGVAANGTHVTLNSGSHTVEAALTLQSGKKEILTLEVTAK